MPKVLRRPRKEMMLAVNASIDGERADVNKLIKEYKLSKNELGKRLELRDGEKYDLRRKGGRPKGSGAKRGPGRPRKTGRGPGRPPAARAGSGEDLISIMDGRTKTVTLLKIAYKASELLDAKPKPEVAKVEKALDEAETLKARYEELGEKYEEALELIGG